MRLATRAVLPLVMFALLAASPAPAPAAPAPAAPAASDPSAARPVLFPPLPNGQRETRDERDVAPFLAAWKANALARQRAVAQVATANQLQYDARWYDLTITWASGSSISGTTRMKATVVSGPISTVDLDFYSNMIVDAATSAGGATTWSRAGNILTLNLDRAYANGETVDVTVTYHGNPNGAGYFGIQTVNGRQILWSLSEAYGARTWWPCKDAPEDKADSTSIHFTAPSTLTMVSNGTLISRTVNGANATTTWSERYPIATYLVSVAAYPYTVTNDWYRPTPTDSMLIRFHNYPESAAGAAAVQAKVKNMITAFAARFGEYPFISEKYGHAEFPFSGGMEHQTCTSLGVFNESVVAHELTHQWWGDLVTCRDFHHIWLNEGFATYGEALWQEALGGTAAYFADININKFFGPGSIWVPDATNENRVFDSNLSYNKGSWVLHMLRHIVGDTNFFAILQQYHTTWGYQSATTENFRDVCESVSGLDLHDFFQQWIYGEYYPIYRAAWTSAPAGGGYDVTVTLEQRQSWQMFHLPVDITVTTSAGDEPFVVDDSLASQSFVLHTTGVPSQIQLDKDGWILKGLDLVVSNPQFDRSVLLVNGVEWATYGSEITSAYTDHAFSGAYGVDFWDTFGVPAGGYPAALPAPLGHGAVPPDILGHYRNVIWVGNNFNGDLSSWQETPVLSYLRAGGDLLLMSRMGDQFLGDSLRIYLGVNWTSTSATLLDCVATRPGFNNVATLGTQSLCAVFDSVRTTPESELLFRTGSGFTPSRGIAAVRMPAGGAGNRPWGGRFAFVSGRPYRWNHAQLKTNVEQILANRFHESQDGTAVGDAPNASSLSLDSPWPNPSQGATALHFSLPRPGRARLVVLDVAGRRLRTVLDEPLGAGPHEARWDGADARGQSSAAGLYWVRLEVAGEAVVRRLVRVR